MDERQDYMNEPESVKINRRSRYRTQDLEEVQQALRSNLTDSEVRSAVSQLWNRVPGNGDPDPPERKERDTLEEAPIGITIGLREEDGYPIQYANRAFQELTGYQNEELIDRDIHFLQGEETDMERVAQILEALRNRESLTVELRNYRKDGSMFWNRLSISPLNTDGHRDRGFVAFQQDVTERRRTQEELREQVGVMRDVTDSMPGVTYEFRKQPGGQYTFEHLSDGFEKLSGVDSEQARLSSSRVFQAVHPEDRDRLVQSIESSASSMSKWRSEFRFLHPDGDVKWVMGTSIPQERAGGVIAWRGVLIDVTRRKNLEQELKAQIEENERVRQLKSDVLERVTHEVRTPLNSILGLSSIMEETDLTPEQRRHLKGIENAGRSLLFLLNEIMDLDRIETGQLELCNKPLDLHTLLSDVMEMCRPRGRDADVTVTETVTERVPEWVVGDSERLQRILVNLVSNAVTFAGDGCVDVLVDCKERREEFVKLLFSVSDTGPGISAEKQETLFQTPEHGADSSSTNTPDAETGLSICRHLVHRMNGDIGVKSEPGDGATFWFTVKLELPAAGQIPDVNSGPSAGVQGASVLVADDNAPIRNMFGQLLKGAGVNVTLARSGDEALDLLGEDQGETFDTIFLDRRMGTISGPDVIHTLNEQGGAPPPEKIHMISGDSREEILQHVPEEHIAGILNKPIQESELIDAIRTSLQAQSASTSPRGQLDVQLKKEVEGRPFDVLVADDDPAARHILEMYMEKYADRIDTAGTGREAVGQRFDGSPDVLLMDLDMPDLDGIEATKQIREREQREGREPVPVVIQTGRTRGGVQEKSQEAGADVFLNKPVDRNELYRATLDVIA